MTEGAMFMSITHWYGMKAGMVLLFSWWSQPGQPLIYVRLLGVETEPCGAAGCVHGVVRVWDVGDKTDDICEQCNGSGQKPWLWLIEPVTELPKGWTIPGRVTDGAFMTWFNGQWGVWEQGSDMPMGRVL